MCQRTQIFDKYLASSVRHRHLNVKVNTYCQRKTNTQTNKNRIPLPCQENLNFKYKKTQIAPVNCFGRQTLFPFVELFFI